MALPVATKRWLFLSLILLLYLTYALGTDSFQNLAVPKACCLCAVASFAAVGDPPT